MAMAIFRSRSPYAIQVFATRADVQEQNSVGEKTKQVSASRFDSERRTNEQWQPRPEVLLLFIEGQEFPTGQLLTWGQWKIKRKCRSQVKWQICTISANRTSWQQKFTWFAAGSCQSFRFCKSKFWKKWKKCPLPSNSNCFPPFLSLEFKLSAWFPRRKVKKAAVQRGLLFRSGGGWGT